MPSNISANPTYGVYISQLIKISRICDTFQSFVIRHRLLTERLTRQGFGTINCVNFSRNLSEDIMHLSMLAPTPPPHPGQGGEFSLFGMADLPQGSGY